MKHVVMGTAGHVDHGKTALVKRLTGIDTDRLDEEKRRGMTIELGFAPMQLPNGVTVSIIDVPGHEKFIKTMLSGASGIDFAVLVIAADEGVMPQTREHLNILSLLNVDTGIVAITKTDLADMEWLELVREDVRQLVRGTGFENAPVIPVSSVTGEGINELLEAITRLSEEAGRREPAELFRMPVDRSFVLPGYGNVVTGTLSGGKIAKGDTVEVLPRGIEARVRGVQVHGSYVDNAGAGERCALNLSGVEKSDVKRGDTIAFPGTVEQSCLLDAVLHTIRNEGAIEHNQRVHIHIGTSEVLGRIRVIGEDAIQEGSIGYVQLKLEEPVAAIRGDRFVIRSYSPVKTLGGGRVLLHHVPNRPRFSERSMRALKLEDSGKVWELIGLVLENSRKPMNVDDIWRYTFINKAEIKAALGMDESGAICLKSAGKYISHKNFDQIIIDINKEFEKLYARYPFRFRIDKEEIRSKLFQGWDVKDFAALIDEFVGNNIYNLQGSMILQPGSSVTERINSRRETAAIEDAVLKGGINPPKLKQFFEKLSILPDAGEEAVKFLVLTGRLIDLGEDMFLHADTVEKVKQAVTESIRQKGSIKASELRDILGTGRKLAIALMEYLDGTGFTRRSGDERFPGPEFKEK